MNQSDQLKPCPFCGGAASADGHIKYGKPLGDTWWADGSEITEAFFVNCMKCGARRRSDLSGGYQTRDEAIAAWNTRDPSLLDRITELTNGLREATEAIGVCIDGFEKSNPTRGGLAAIHMLKEARERYQALLSTQTGEG